MKVFCALIASRKFWVAVGGLVLTVAAVLGLDAAKAERVVNAIEALAAAVILAIGIEDHGKKDMGRLPVPLENNAGAAPADRA